MVSEVERIEKKIASLKRDIESLEISKNKAIFEEIAILDIHIRMNEEDIGELIKILKEKMGEIDRQYKKFYDNEVKKELDYWRERAVCELAFLYVLLEEYEEAIVLIRKEFERNRSSYEEPFSNLELTRIFFRRSEISLEDYEHSVLWERRRLATDMAPNTRDKNMEWSLRAAFTFWECLYSIWKNNWRAFVESGEMAEEARKENAGLIRELTKRIKNIEGEIV